jgi:hypothetical protein
VSQSPACDPLVTGAHTGPVHEQRLGTAQVSRVCACSDIPYIYLVLIRVSCEKRRFHTNRQVEMSVPFGHFDSSRRDHHSFLNFGHLPPSDAAADP